MPDNQKHLLLVEDEVPLRQVIAEQLTDRGFLVEQCDSGEAAMSASTPSRSNATRSDIDTFLGSERRFDQLAQDVEDRPVDFLDSRRAPRGNSNLDVRYVRKRGGINADQRDRRHAD